MSRNNFRFVGYQSAREHAKALEKVAHPAIWSEMEFVKNFEVLETGVA